MFPCFPLVLSPLKYGNILRHLNFFLFRIYSFAYIGKIHAFNQEQISLIFVLVQILLDRSLSDR